MLLIVILVLSSLVLVWMGVRQWRRGRLFARFAHACGLKFSPGDPFGLAGRYGGCRLLRLGHSGHAANVIFGSFDGWFIRVFDYRFEAGHGVRRVGRRSIVIVADVNRPLSCSFCCRGGAAGSPDWAMTGALTTEGVWRWAGDEALVRRVMERWPGQAPGGLVVETLDSTVIFATEDNLDSPGLRGYLRAAVDCLGELAGPVGQA